MVHILDELDARLLLLLTDEPRIGVLECSRRLGVARGTVQARLDRMIEHRVLRGFPPALDLAAIGYGLTAFAVLEIAQGRRGEVTEQLAAIDEVCEVHATTGQGDLLVRMVATSNDDLQRVIDEVVTSNGVQRTSTSIALSTPVPPRVRPLLDRSAGTPRPDHDADTTSSAGGTAPGHAERDTGSAPSEGGSTTARPDCGDRPGKQHG